MKRRRWACTLVFLILLAAGICAEDFAGLFGKRYSESLASVASEGPSWCAELERLGADPYVLVPMVFPEVLKYSLLRDEVETVSLAALSVTRGSDLADFSIGRFEMKPSFVERIEITLASMEAPAEAFQAVIQFPPGSSEFVRRAIRLQRLRDIRWQLLYLASFSFIVRGRFDLSGLDGAALVRFLAAAYNRGFWLSREQISAAADWKLFPRGAHGRPGPYRYADIAVDCFLRHWPDLYARVIRPTASP